MKLKDIVKSYNRNSFHGELIRYVSEEILEDDIERERLFHLKREHATKEDISILWELVDKQLKYTREKHLKKRRVRERENRRNSKGLTTREQQKQEKIAQVQELKAHGFSQSEIAKNLGINRSTVSRYWEREVNK